MNATHVALAIVCGAVALPAQSGRTMVLVEPIVPGQTARIEYRHPPTANYNIYAILGSVAPMAGSTPIVVPGFTILGEPRIQPATALSMFTGQLSATGTVAHSFAVPTSPSLVGTALDVQGADLSVLSQTLAFSDNDLLAAIQPQSWRTPHTLSSTQTNEPPSLMVLPNGHAVAVWLEGGTTILASRLTPGSGWSNVIALTTLGSALNVAAACDPAGNVTAVWRENSDQSIYGARLSAGNVWSTPALLEFGLGQADQPQVVMDAAGNAIATWWQYDGAFNTGVVSMLAAHAAPGQPFGAPTALETNNQGYGEPPSIAGNAAGQVVVVWRWSYPQGGNWYSTVMSNRFTPGVGWGTATPVTGDTDVDADIPQVAIDANGNAYATWAAYAPGSGYRELHAATSSGGAFSPTARLDPVGNSSSITTKVIVTGVGTAIAVWVEIDATSKVMVSRHSNGTWSPAEVAVATPVSARYPQVAADGTGRITITYMHGTPPSLHYCYATQFLPGLGWLSPFRIDDNNHNGFTNARLGTDANHRVVVLISEYWILGNKLLGVEFR